MDDVDGALIAEVRIEVFRAGIEKGMERSITVQEPAMVDVKLSQLQVAELLVAALRRVADP